MEFFVKKLLKKYKITHRLSRAYTPSDNAICERFNRTIKTMFSKYSIQTGDLSLDKIDELVANYNSNVHSSTKKRPIDLHPGKKDGNVSKGDVRTARKNVNKRIRKAVAKQKELYPDEINVGDHVRVDHEIDEGLRDTIFRKKFLRQWSFNIFKVVGKSRASKMRNAYYTLQFEDGTPINRRFYRQDILKVDKDKLLRKFNTVSEASKQKKHDPANPYDFYEQGLAVINAEQYKARKTKSNQHGYVWELTFEGIPYKQMLHPDRAIKAGRQKEFVDMYNDPKKLIGKRFKSYWPAYNRWYEGTITEYNSKTSKHKLEFDSGVVEHDNLKTTKYKWQLI